MRRDRQCLSAQGSPEGGPQPIRGSLKEDPHYAPNLGLGKVYERMKKEAESVEAYERYLHELPSAKDAADAKDAQRAVARLQKNWGRAKKAVTSDK